MAMEITIPKDILRQRHAEELKARNAEIYDLYERTLRENPDASRMRIARWICDLFDIDVSTYFRILKKERKLREEENKQEHQNNKE